jgi:hypothetical protein
MFLLDIYPYSRNQLQAGNSDWENKKSSASFSTIQKRFSESNNLTFDESLPNHEDWEFWVKLFYHSKSVCNNPEVLAFYRIREDLCLLITN